MRYLDAETASSIDAALMRTTTTTTTTGEEGGGREQHQPPHGWSIEQLMELAGLAVADVLHDDVARAIAQKKKKKTNATTTTPCITVVVLCGPGNNGGDGLVAAKHLAQRGGCWHVDVWHPKLTEDAIATRRRRRLLDTTQQKSSCWKNETLFERLGDSCKAAGARFLEEDAFFASSKGGETLPLFEYDVIVDALFGFSFRGEPRAPYKGVLEDVAKITKASGASGPVVVSVDVPSGDDVNEGLTPQVRALSRRQIHIRAVNRRVQRPSRFGILEQQISRRWVVVLFVRGKTEQRSIRPSRGLGRRVGGVERPKGERRKSSRCCC